MNTQKRKYITILTLFCLLILLIAGTTSFAFASEQKYEHTNVIDDLLSAENFSIYDYPANTYGEIELINFVEYGYSANGNHDYGLYVYVYNPRQLEFSELPTANKIQLSVGNGTYKKYSLKFLSKSSNYNDFVKERLFYKFKIEGADELLSKLDKEARIYNISGIELLEQTSKTAKEYHVGGKYTVTGYAKGYGLDSNDESTLNQNITNLRTIKLNVESTFFRTPPYKLNTQHQLNTVYFGVPNQILKEYGNLQKVQAEWYEYETEPIIIADKNLYNSLEPYIGVEIGEYTNDKNCPSLSVGYKKVQYTGGSTTSYKWTYNIGLGLNTLTDRYSPQLSYLFLAEGNALDYTLPNDLLLNYIYLYDKSFNRGTLPIKNDSISADLFKTYDNPIDCYKNVNIDAEDKFNMLSYDSTNPWWQKWIDYPWFNAPSGLGKDFKDIPPIYKVSDNDLLNDIANKLYIDKNDTVDFAKYYAEQKVMDKSTFLFRFAVSDYYSAQLRTSFGGGLNGYMAEQTAYLDFDILSLTFEKEGTYINIPVVSNPIDIVGDVTPPPANIPWWLIILLVIVGIILVIMFLPQILLFLFKLIIWIIKLPFVLVKKTYELCKQKALKREQANNINALQTIQDLERYEARNEAQQSKPKAKRKRKRTNNST